MSRRGLAAVASVLDQAASSATNILVLVLAARLSSASGFADFSMVYVTFSVLLGLNMAYVGQTVVLEKEAAGRLGTVCRSSVLFTAGAAGVAGLVLAVAGLVVPGDAGWAFLALGLVLPLVLVQDGLRYCFSTLRVPGRALAADALRLVCVVAALAVQPQGASAARLVLVWGVSALPALGLGVWLLRPYVRGARGDVRPYLRRGHLGQRFVVEFAVGNGSSQLAVLGLGAFATPLAVGALRGATTLFGPLNVLFNSANAFGPPIVGRASGKRGVVRLTALMGAPSRCSAPAGRRSCTPCRTGWAGTCWATPGRRRPPCSRRRAPSTR